MSSPSPSAPPAAPAGTAAPEPAPAPRLWTRSLILVLALAFFGFGHEAIVQPVLPLVVLDRGGDAVLVGLLIAAFGLPTIVLRPFVGYAVDVLDHGRIMRGGAVLIAAAPLGFLVPALWTTFVARLVQGVGWSAYGASGHALLARIAPPNRRGEASGYYNATNALAILLLPATGLWLYANVGASAAFLVTAAFGGLGLLVALAIRVPPRSVAPAPRRTGWRVALDVLERTAAVPLVVTILFMTAQSLFIAFAPIYAQAHGIPLADLGPFFVLYGSVVLVGQLTLGRVSDRFGRRRTAASGLALGSIGLVIAGLGSDLASLTAGGLLYSASNALVTATMGATTIERAPPGRIGAATATYSMGYQAGQSAGGLLWGVTIAAAGYPWPFLVAAGLLLAGLAVVLATLGPGLPSGSSPGAGGLPAR